MRALALFLSFAALAAAADAPPALFSHGPSILHAHNCYPYEGQWDDRITRALGTGFPVAIEQDLAWGVDPATGKRAPVVTHNNKTKGSEPTLRAYFFDRVRPTVEAALASGNRSAWPIIILHFDFKSNEQPLLEAVWNLLGEYEPWLTTAPKTARPGDIAPLDRKPILVLTEDSDAQEKVFYNAVPVGKPLRLFGSAHTHGVDNASRDERTHLAATLPPEKLLSDPPTNYRRWWNASWWGVEEGGQQVAGDWTAADAARLHALVNRAHELGYWIRFYALDGFEAQQDRGWGNGYNFGSLAAVKIRWQAALDAGVDLIATDQYEDFADFRTTHAAGR